MTTVAPEKPATFQGFAAAPRKSGGSVISQLMKLRRQNGGEAIYFRNSLQAIADHFNATFAAIDVRVGACSVEETFTKEKLADDKLQSIARAMLLEAASENRSQSRIVKSSMGEVAVIAATVPDAESLQITGAVVLVCGIKSKPEADTQLRELQTLAALIAANKPIPQQTHGDKRMVAMQRALEKAAQCGSLTELAFNLVNSLSEKLRCVQTVLGVEDRGAIRVVAISGFDRVPQKSPGVMVIRQAMEECLDAAQPILAQHLRDEVATDDRSRFLHKQWQQAVHGDAVFSLPLIVDGKVVAVVGLRRPSTQPFTEDEVTRIPQMLEPFAPAVALFRATDRTLGQHIRQRISTLLGGKASGRIVAAVMALLVTVFLIFGQMEYRVATTCVVAPQTTHHLVAPYSGAIADVLVSVGDRVQAGQVVARLDTRDLQLEQERLSSELAAARVVVDRALATKDGASAFAAKAQMDAIAAQLETTRERLHRAEITAPIAGTVMGTNLRERIGQVVNLGDPMLHIASDNGRFVELHVPESAVIHLKEGQSGNFTSVARPHAATPLTLRRIRPAAQVIDGQNVFVAEAEVASPEDWIRVGMEGYAKIGTGPQPVWWIVFHSTIDFVRRGLWI